MRPRTLWLGAVLALALWAVIGFVVVQLVSAADPAPTGEIAEPLYGTKGTASWYCGAGSPCTSGYPGGLYAAAGSELQVGDWRGSKVAVCAESCVTVTLIDVCGCPGARVIDLYREAFAQLADPSRGVIPVTVESGGASEAAQPRMTLPPTDTARTAPSLGTTGALLAVLVAMGSIVGILATLWWMLGGLEL